MIYWRHYDKIGKDAVGEQIGDVIYDAFRKYTCLVYDMHCFADVCASIQSAVL
jgi:hypothetical protein